VEVTWRPHTLTLQSLTRPAIKCSGVFAVEGVGRCVWGDSSDYHHPVIHAVLGSCRVSEVMQSEWSHAGSWPHRVSGHTRGCRTIKCCQRVRNTLLTFSIRP
jgi:hypothetical protein